MSELVRLTIHQSGAAEIVIDRPERHNAMTLDMYESLLALIAECATISGVRCVLFRGAGGKSFISGTDIAYFKCLRDGRDGAAYEAFVERVIATGRPLHILVNNAGLVAAGLKRDTRGYEELFATNHLGHFHLTLRLWPALLAARGARVVSVSSRGHQVAGIDFDDPNFLHRPYDKWVAYGQSKTANALFAVGVNARGEHDGIRAFSLHPDAVMTGLARNMTQAEVAGFGMFDEQGRVRNDPERDFKSIEQGAATAVWCATSPQLEGIGGAYCENSDVAPLIESGAPMTPGVRPWAVDRTFASRLWTLSEQLTDCSIPTC